MSDRVRVFVGYEPREAVAFHVLSHSIQSRASAPVSITPVALRQLGGDALIGELPHR